MNPSRFIPVLLVTATATLLTGCGKQEPVKKKAAPVVIELTPLPPPLPSPPPPPKQEEPEPEPEEQEMIEQKPIVEAEPEDPGPEEPPDMSTGLTGEGSNSFGLTGRGDGNGGGGSTKGRKGGGRFDRYAVVLQNTLASELRRNAKTRVSSFNVEVALRIDAEGRITSLKPKSSTGDPSLDQALRHDFIGVRFSEPPPADMLMPIQTRLTGRKR